MKRSRWLLRTAWVIVIAACAHVAALWLLPRAIVWIVQRRIAGSVGVNHAQHAPLPDANWHTIVMPSPDLLYSACVFDVSERPVVIEAPASDTYLSVSGFADNTDNFFAVNDRTLGGGPLRVVLARDAASAPGERTVIMPPSRTGVVIFRQLVLGPSMLEAARARQQACVCHPM